MPEWLPVDRLLAIVFGLVALVALFQTRRYHRKALRDKALCIDEHGPFRLVGVKSGTNAPIKIEYDGYPVEQVWRTRVLLWNQGYRTIDSGDFIGPITATCGPKGSFLSCGVETSDVATNVSVDFDRSKQAAGIAVRMLRGGQAAILFFDTDAKEGRPNMDFQTRDAETSGKPRFAQRINPRLFEVLAAAIAFPIFGILVIVVSAILLQVTGVETPLPSWAAFPLLILFALVLVPVVHGSGILGRKGGEHLLRRKGASVHAFYQRKYARAGNEPADDQAG